MSSTDNIIEIDIEYILSYQEVSDNYKCGSWYKTNDIFLCQNDRRFLMFLRKSQVVKIQPIVDFITRVEVVSVCSALSQASFVCFCLFPRSKKGERWSGAREILGRRNEDEGKLSAHSPSGRTHLSFGVTCVYAFNHLHLAPWFLVCFSFVCRRLSLGGVLGEWRGTSAGAMHVQFYQTLGVT